MIEIAHVNVHGNERLRRSLTDRKRQRFLAGMFVAYLQLAGFRDRRQLHRKTIRAARSIVVVTLLMLGHLNRLGEPWSYRASFAVDLAIVAILLLHCAMERQRVAAWRGARLLMFFPVFEDRFLPTLIVSTVLAFGSLKLLEQPLRTFFGRTDGSHRSQFRSNKI